MRGRRYSCSPAVGTTRLRRFSDEIPSGAEPGPLTLGAHSADAAISGSHVGAMSWALLQTMHQYGNDPRLSYVQVCSPTHHNDKLGFMECPWADGRGNADPTEHPATPDE